MNGPFVGNRTVPTPDRTSLASTRRREFWAGVRATLPLVAGAIPFGIIFGAAAVTGGISAPGAVAMSAFVFAGSAQFLAAGLVASGAGIAVVILTTFVVNLRHMLYALSLAPHMKHLPQRWLAPLSFWLTDESYVVVIRRYQRADAGPRGHWFYLGSALAMYVNWQVCTWIGIVMGQSVSDPSRWGLDFALIVTFIGMLVPLLTNRPTLICILVAGGTALALHALPHQLGLIGAALAGVCSGIAAGWLERRPDSG